MTMSPNPPSILPDLAQLGRAPVVVRVDSRLFPPDLVRQCAARFAPYVSANQPGQVTVAPAGDQAREAFRHFTSELLAAVLQGE